MPSTVPPPELGPPPANTASRHDWVIDIAFAAVVGVFTCGLHLLPVVGRMDMPVRYGDNWLNLIAAVAFVAPLALRRHYPLLMTILVAAAGLFQVAVSAVPSMTVIIVPIVSYTVARWVIGKRSRLVVWLGLAGSLIGPARWLFSYNAISGPLILSYMLGVVVCLGTVITPYSIGRRAQETAYWEQNEVQRTTEQYRMALAQQEQRARMAEVNARNDIARELHDIVAHSLSVIIVQAEGGRAIAAKKPEKAPEVLDTIASTGREALAEMRRLVSVLRMDPDGVDYAPTPGLADIDGLVARTGESARLREVGRRPLVSPAIGLTAYRVVQEALTNVLKHAGPGAQADVTIAYRHHDILIEIRDDGLGPLAPDDGHGNGLRGMQERVASMGGEIVAGPQPDGGFLVRVWLPFTVVAKQRTERPRGPRELLPGPGAATGSALGAPRPQEAESDASADRAFDVDPPVAEASPGPVGTAESDLDAMAVPAIDQASSESADRQTDPNRPSALAPAPTHEKMQS